MSTKAAEQAVPNAVPHGEHKKDEKPMSESMKRLLQPSERQKGNQLKLISGTRAVESAGILAMESWYSLGHGAGHRGTRDAKSEIKEIDKEIAFIRAKLNDVAAKNETRTATYQAKTTLHDDSAKQLKEILDVTRSRVAATQKKQKELSRYEIPPPRHNYLKNGAKKDAPPNDELVKTT